MIDCIIAAKLRLLVVLANTMALKKAETQRLRVFMGACKVFLCGFVYTLLYNTPL
jgi:hypothetical protein